MADKSQKSGAEAVSPASGDVLDVGGSPGDSWSRGEEGAGVTADVTQVSQSPCSAPSVHSAGPSCPLTAPRPVLSLPESTGGGARGSAGLLGPRLSSGRRGGFAPGYVEPERYPHPPPESREHDVGLSGARPRHRWS